MALKTNPRIDAYIEKSAAFARPILRHLRKAVHQACPEVEEAIKWGMPAFLYQGKLLANMAAFKAHATFGFWRGKEVLGDKQSQIDAMGQFGRIESIDALPKPATLAALIRKAVVVSKARPARREPRHPSRKPIRMPRDFATALAASRPAAATYEKFPPSARYDYLEWVTEAKKPDTRAKRIAQSVEWLAEGKRRHWKHEAS